MVQRVAGQHARSMVRTLAGRALLVLLVLVGVTVTAGLSFGWRNSRFWLVEAAAVLGALMLDRLAIPVIDRWDRGARGEEEVGRTLTPLTLEGWRVLHDVDLGSGNVDHVLIGPAGVFTVETKSHRGRVSTDALEPRFLRQAYAEAKAIEKLTETKTEPLLVFSQAYVVGRPITRRRGVLVLPARMLVGHLRQRASILRPEEIERLHQRLVEAVARGGPPL